MFTQQRAAKSSKQYQTSALHSQGRQYATGAGKQGVALYVSSSESQCTAVENFCSVAARP